MREPEHHMHALSILLVDDDDVSVESVLRGLDKAGVAAQVVVAGDGVEALQIMRGEHPEKRLAEPYIVLLDLNMPGMDGFHLLEVVRADPALRHVVIFVLTTSSLPADRARAYAGNIAGYMVKSYVGPQFALLAGFLDKYSASVMLPD